MKKLLLILIALPMIGFGQTSFDINDYKMLDSQYEGSDITLSTILKASEESGYKLIRNKDNSIIWEYESGYGAFLILEKFDLEIFCKGTKKRLGYITKFIYLLDNNMQDFRVWKVETIMHSIPVQGLFIQDTFKDFEKINKSLNQSMRKDMRKDKFKLMDSKDLIDIGTQNGGITELYETYDVGIGKKFINSRNDTVLITTAKKRNYTLPSLGEDSIIGSSLYVSSESLIWSSFTDSVFDKKVFEAIVRLEDDFKEIKNEFKIIKKYAEVNSYDLKSMIDIFLDDCKKYNISK